MSRGSRPDLLPLPLPHLDVPVCLLQVVNEVGGLLLPELRARGDLLEGLEEVVDPLGKVGLAIVDDYLVVALGLAVKELLLGKEGRKRM